MVYTLNFQTLGLIASTTNADSLRDVDGTTNRTSLKRGTQTPQAIQFLNNPFGTIQELATPLDLRFGCKVAGQEEGSYVVSNYNPGSGLFDYVKTGAGVTTLYTASPNWNTIKLNQLLGYDPTGFAEQTEIRTEPDVAGSLDGTCFILHDAAGSVGVWIALNNGATAIPAAAAACARAIKVATINTNDTANTVAQDIAVKLAADAQFAATAFLGNVVTVIDTQVGARAAAADGGAPSATGFEFTVWVPGSAPNTLDKQPYVDLVAEWYWNINGVVTKSQTFTVRVYFDINNTAEGTTVNGDPSPPPPGFVVTFPFAGPLADINVNNNGTGYLTGEALLGLFSARIIALAGAGAYTYNASPTEFAPKPGALFFCNLEFPASANPTINIRDGDPAAGTILAAVTNPAPAAAAYWAGIFFFGGDGHWHKFFSAFQ